jgi:cell division protease FtsH
MSPIKLRVTIKILAWRSTKRRLKCTFGIWLQFTPLAEPRNPISFNRTRKSDMTNNQPSNNPQGPQYQEPPQLPWWRYLVWFVVLVLFSWYWLIPDEDGRQSLSYSEFKTKVVAEQIAWVEFQGDRVSGEFRNIGMPASTGDSKLSARFITTLPPIQDPQLISLLEQHEVEIRAVSG